MKYLPLNASRQRCVTSRFKSIPAEALRNCWGAWLALFGPHAEVRIPAEKGHRSDGKAAGIPLGKRPPFRSNPASVK